MPRSGIVGSYGSCICSCTPPINHLHSNPCSQRRLRGTQPATGTLTRRNGSGTSYLHREERETIAPAVQRGEWVQRFVISPPILISALLAAPL